MSDVMAVDPMRHNNARLMVDCGVLGYLTEPVADVTYNAGRFWNIVSPPALRFDLDPQWDAQVADFRSLPLGDGSLGCLVLDPPYKLNGTSSAKGPAALDDGYGVGGQYRSIGEIHDVILDGIVEAHRVLRVGGYLLLKCQAQQSCGRMNDQPGLFAAYAVASGGWKDVDRLHVLTTPRKQPGTQRTARSNMSTLVVLQRRKSPMKES